MTMTVLGTLAAGKHFAQRAVRTSKERASRRTSALGAVVGLAITLVLLVASTASSEPNPQGHPGPELELQKQDSDATTLLLDLEVQEAMVCIDRHRYRVRFRLKNRGGTAVSGVHSHWGTGIPVTLGYHYEFDGWSDRLGDLYYIEPPGAFSSKIVDIDTGVVSSSSYYHLAPAMYNGDDSGWAIFVNAVPKGTFSWISSDPKTDRIISRFYENYRISSFYFPESSYHNNRHFVDVTIDRGSMDPDFIWNGMECWGTPVR